MKKLFALCMILAFCAGCGTLAKESGYWQHDSNFASWEHTAFSLWGYKNCSKETARMSERQGWWGTNVEECPAP